MRLHVFDIEKIDDLIFNDAKPKLTKDSSIMEIFTDFKHIPPMLIEETASALHVREIMEKAHVNLEIVIDNKRHFRGILPLLNLSDEELGKKAIMEGREKADLLIKDCMWRKSELHALDYKEFKGATINEVIDALQHIGQRYCLVVDHEEHQIRGVISAGDISRALNIPIDIQRTGIGTSFLTIFNRLNHGI
ncbi:MAG: histidine kinase [Gammaproteobacteria bacterium]|nr:MAG: histidine kinase [Gammaproteobacteria bacterium]